MLKKHFIVSIAGFHCIKNPGEDEKIVMKAIALCFKPFLKPEEALIYCNWERTHFARQCEQFGVYKNNMGYYRKEDLDKMLSGAAKPLSDRASKLKI